MKQIAKDIWTQDGDRIRFHGIPFDTRGVIVRLPDGTLWLHSPVSPTDERVAEITALGPIAHIIAPNLIHGAYTEQWAALAPDAKVWVSPLFPRKHADIACYAVLTDEAPPDWAATIDQCHFAGSKAIDDMVFLHRPSDTLIITDILQRHDPTREPFLWRMIKGAFGIMAPGGRVPPDIRMSFRDRDAARAARDRILSWEFDRILLPHSVPVDTGGKEFFRKAMSWLDQPTP
ncbi:DUF4336 domain-containing protein [Pseudoruegeria sp. HB172150]|uniref:DUF4336 domain-containing protein n=1 Tax=Pseudoruegeria sp. HB172150 TaxID=2721164 RepID=UPI001552722A|nr:DUF4336 domain-containing protein [Pseudoruegeria sp. HB172150]